MRISDWSSDVCSSDLRRIARTLSGRNAQLYPGAARRPSGAWAMRQRPTPALFAIGGNRALRALEFGLALPGIEQLIDAIAIGVQIGRASCRERVCQYV